MNNKLCRLPGCEIKELHLCLKCHLITTSICICCKNIVDIQTYIHIDFNGL